MGKNGNGNRFWTQQVHLQCRPTSDEVCMMYKIMNGLDEVNLSA